MTQATNYKRSFSGSMGAGMKSVFGSTGRRFYELEFRTASEKHRAGETQKVIVDQIELGRDSQCGIRFGEDCKTVSRRHAAIIKDGNGWKLVQLSKTNSTYLNGRKVENEWYLQNGDEIQLSTDGPRIGFLVKEGAGSLVKSIGLTNRLSLFRQQALRPYKRALTVISSVLVVSVGILSFLLSDVMKDNRLQAAAIKKYEDQHSADSIKIEEAIASASKATNRAESAEKRLANLSRQVRRTAERVDTMVNIQVGSVSDAAIKAAMPYVYFIRAYEVTLFSPDGTPYTIPNYRWKGTGFLLADGRFITARHVVEPWMMSPDGIGLEINNILTEVGGKCVAKLIAVSPSGDKIFFTSEQTITDKSRDKKYEIVQKDDAGEVVIKDGDTIKSYYYLTTDYNVDWAYIRTSKEGGLPFDAQASTNLRMRTPLTSIGYPAGIGGEDMTNVQPIWGTAVVAKDGLHNGMILVTDDNTEQGNSGGPMFISNNEGKLVVVGIVSNGRGNNTGFYVPISNLK